MVILTLKKFTSLRNEKKEFVGKIYSKSGFSIFDTNFVSFLNLKKSPGMYRHRYYGPSHIFYTRNYYYKSWSYNDVFFGTLEPRFKIEYSQKQFIKNSVHEINTPLTIIRTNIDLLKMKIPNNKYITNIESGSKIIQYIYDDLSYLIKKDRVVYEKEYLDFTKILFDRLEFFDEIAVSNSLYFINNIEIK